MGKIDWFTYVLGNVGATEWSCTSHTLKLTLEGEHHCQNNFVLLDSNFLTTLHMYLSEL